MHARSKMGPPSHEITSIENAFCNRNAFYHVLNQLPKKRDEVSVCRKLCLFSNILDT